MFDMNQGTSGLGPLALGTQAPSLGFPPMSTPGMSGMGVPMFSGYGFPPPGGAQPQPRYDGGGLGACAGINSMVSGTPQPQPAGANPMMPTAPEFPVSGGSGFPDLPFYSPQFPSGIPGGAAMNPSSSSGPFPGTMNPGRAATPKEPFMQTPFGLVGPGVGSVPGPGAVSGGLGQHPFALPGRGRGGRGRPLGRPRKHPLDPAALEERRFQPYTPDAEGKPGRKRKDTLRSHLKSHLKPPKQSPSAWQIFFTEELQKIKAESPGERLNVAHVAKDAGQRYAALPEEERQKYQERSQEAKEGWEKEMAEWRAKLTPEDIKQENMYRSAQRKLGKSRRGNLKDPNAPKKPLSAYFLFLRTIRTDPELSKQILEGEQETTRQSVLAAAKWRSLSEAEKQPFLERADKDKAIYEKQRREYEASHGIRPHTDAGPQPPSAVDVGEIGQETLGEDALDGGSPSGGAFADDMPSAAERAGETDEDDPAAQFIKGPEAPMEASVRELPSAVPSSV